STSCCPKPRTATAGSCCSTRPPKGAPTKKRVREAKRSGASAARWRTSGSPSRAQRLPRPASRSVPPVHWSRQESPQRDDIDGLHEMLVEARVARPLDVLRPPPSGQRDEQRRLLRELGAQTARNLVAVHARQADVEQHGLGREARERRERLRSAR